MPQEDTPERTETPSQFEKLLANLARSGVDFAVVGGLAVVLNGYGRVTFDADILVSNAPENLRKLIDALILWGEGAARIRVKISSGKSSVTRVEPSSSGKSCNVSSRGKRLDDFRPRLRFFASNDVRIGYLSPEDLIWLKEESWREKDKMDVLALKEIIAKERDGKGN